MPNGRPILLLTKTQRLVDVLTKCDTQSAVELTQAVCNAVEQFSPGEQFDDITLVVARCTS